LGEVSTLKLSKQSFRDMQLTYKKFRRCTHIEGSPPSLYWDENTPRSLDLLEMQFIIVRAWLHNLVRLPSGVTGLTTWLEEICSGVRFQLLPGVFGGSGIVRGTNSQFGVHFGLTELRGGRIMAEDFIAVSNLAVYSVLETLSSDVKLPSDMDEALEMLATSYPLQCNPRKRG